MEISQQLSSIAGAEVSAGKSFRCLLPDHDDSTPSCSVDDRKGVWYCQGCKRGGGVVQFYALYTGRDPASKQVLADCYAELRERGLIAGDVKRRRGDGPAPAMAEFETAAATPPQVKTQGQLRQRVLDAVNAFYQSRLVEGTAAWTFLLSRGLSPATIRRSGLGYAPRAGLAQIAEACGVEEDALADAGIVAKYGRQGPSHHFNDRLVFPVEQDGVVVAFHSRVLDDGSKAAKYKFSQKTGGVDKGSLIYGGSAARQLLAADPAGRLVVVEGNVDALLLQQAGVAAVAAMGSKVSLAMMGTIESLSQRVDYAFDNDDAGRGAARGVFRHYVRRRDAELDVRFTSLEGFNDPADYLAAGGSWSDVRSNSFADIILDAAGRAEGADLDCFGYLSVSDGVAPAIKEGLAGSVPPPPEAEFLYTAHLED